MAISDALTQHANKLRTKTGVTSKLTFSDMTRLLDDLSWGKENLLKGTSDQFRDVKANVLYASTADVTHYYDGPTYSGKTLTYSLTLNNLSNTEASIEFVQFTESNDWLSSKHSTMTCPAHQEMNMNVTDTILQAAGSFQVHVIGASNSEYQIKDERLYLGTEPGVWTPNPADKVGGVNRTFLFALEGRRAA